VREPQAVPERLHLNDAAGTAVNLVPFHAGETLAWRLNGSCPCSFCSWRRRPTT
jgi:hypothetical protein